MEHLFGCFLVIIIFHHDAGAFDGKFSGLSLAYQSACLVDDLRLPSKAGFSDRAYLVDVVYAQMNTARTDRFA